MNRQEIQAKIDSLNKKLENQNLSDYHKDFRDAIKTLEKKLENLGEATVDVVKPVKETKPKTERKPRTPKVKTTTTTEKASDIEKAKAEIKRATGKTEEECEAIIEQYKALRAKSQERKKKEEEASKNNQQRIKELKKDNNVIPTTTEKNAPAVIETATEEVPEKIIKEMEVIEDEAKKEAVKEVEKEKPNLKPAEKKDIIKAKTEEKVKVKTEKVIERVTIDTSALLKVIAESIGKFDKDSQKEFLIKLRSDIDKLLSLFAFGGLTDGGVQVMNIQQSNLSSSSVNPTMFGGGGGVEDVSWDVTIHDDYDMETFELNVRGHFENEEDAIKQAIRENDIYVDESNYGQMYYRGNKITIYGATKNYKNGGGVNRFPDFTGKKYEVINKKDRHYGEVGVSLGGWNKDKRGVKYVTLQFPNGSVDTYGEGEIQRILSGGGKIEYNEYGVPKGYLYLSEFANFDSKASGELTDVAETVLEDAFLEDQSEEGQQIHAYLHDLPHFMVYNNRIPNHNPESPADDQPITDNYLIFLPIEDEDEAEANGGVIFHTFFVDTQGYDYPRYITRLVNYFPNLYQTEDLVGMARETQVKSGKELTTPSDDLLELINEIMYDYDGDISAYIKDTDAELSEWEMNEIKKFMNDKMARGARVKSGTTKELTISSEYLLETINYIVEDYNGDVNAYLEDNGSDALDKSEKNEIIKFIKESEGLVNFTGEFFDWKENDEMQEYVAEKSDEYPYSYNAYAGGDGTAVVLSKVPIINAEPIDDYSEKMARGARVKSAKNLNFTQYRDDKYKAIGTTNEVYYIEKGSGADYFLMVDGRTKCKGTFKVCKAFANDIENKKMARGGMTEHGLKLDDRIDFDLSTINKKDQRIVVSDEKGKAHYVDLDKGKRYSNGGNIHKNHKI